MNPRACYSLPVFEAGPFSHLGTSPDDIPILSENEQICNLKFLVQAEKILYTIRKPGPAKRVSHLHKDAEATADSKKRPLPSKENKEDFLL